MFTHRRHNFQPMFIPFTGAQSRNFTFPILRYRDHFFVVFPHRCSFHLEGWVHSSLTVRVNFLCSIFTYIFGSAEETYVLFCGSHAFSFSTLVIPGATFRSTAARSGTNSLDIQFAKRFFYPWFKHETRSHIASLHAVPCFLHEIRRFAALL